MLMPFLRAHRRALPVWSAFALVPVLLAGGLTLVARPSLALKQDAAKPDAAADKTYTLTRVYKANDVSRYQFKVNTTVNSPQVGGNVEIVLQMLLKETVKDVKKDGNATITQEFEEANFKLGELEQEVTSAMPSILETRDKSGAILDMKLQGGSPQFTEGPGANLFKGMTQQTALLPSKPVKIGDSWKLDHTPKDKNDSKITGTATLVGVDTIDGAQTLKIKTVSDTETTTDNPDNGEKVNVKSHAEGVTNIDPVSSKLIKMSATVTSESGPLGKTITQISYTLVKGDPKANKNGKKADDKTADGKKTDATQK